MNTEHKLKYYRNFSINQERYIRAHGIYPIKKITHESGRLFFLHKLTPELSKILTEWTNGNARE